jgi:hypothetical protein
VESFLNDSNRQALRHLLDEFPKSVRVDYKPRANDLDWSSGLRQDIAGVCACACACACVCVCACARARVCMPQSVLWTLDRGQII